MKTKPIATVVGQRRLSGRSGTERGAILIMMVMMLVPLAIVTSTVVDLGVVRWQRSTLQNAADSAAVGAGNLLSGPGSGLGSDGNPQAACLNALRSLRQNLSGFDASDASGGGCGSLPALVSACVANMPAPITLTATSSDGKIKATLIYPQPSATNTANQRVAYVQGGASASAPTDPGTLCRSMIVNVTRSGMPSYFAGVLGIGSTSLTVNSLGSTADPGYTVGTTIAPAPTSPPTTVAPPATPGAFLAQQTIAGSDCAAILGLPNLEAPYQLSGLPATGTAITPSLLSMSKVTMKGCGSIFNWVNAQVWTAYGIGSNGQGTVVVVGDQNRFARFTGCVGASPTLTQTTEGWTGGGASIYYDVAGVGTHWVAVGNFGSVRVSNDDGKTWHTAANPPGGGVPLSEVASDGAGHWMAAASYGGIGTLYYSGDNGENWTTVSGISGASIVRSVAFDATTHQWLAAGSFGQVWASTSTTVNSTAGSTAASWSSVAFLKNSGPAGDDLISITVSPTGLIFVAAGGFGQVYVSNGTSPTGGFKNTASLSWLVVPQRVRTGPSNQVMVVGLANALYVSNDNGTNWTPVTNGVPSLRTWPDVANCAGLAGQ